MDKYITNMEKSFKVDETIESMRYMIKKVHQFGVVYGEIYDPDRSNLDISLSKATHDVQSIDVCPRCGSCVVNTRILTTHWGKHIQNAVNNDIKVSLSPRFIYTTPSFDARKQTPVKKIYTFDIKIK